jgi:hypothetical protein
MKDEFVMRGQTASGGTETLNFGGHKDGYGFLLTEFVIYPSTGIGSGNFEGAASITAGKTAIAPTDPNFNDEGLLAVASLRMAASINTPTYPNSVINDTFVITQDLILMVIESESSTPVNWQCKFKPVKLDTAKQALTNYRQFMIKIP